MPRRSREGCPRFCSPRCPWGSDRIGVSEFLSEFSRTPTLIGATSVGISEEVNSLKRKRPGFPASARAGEKWWTRSQRIRTAGELEFEATLFDSPPPAYLRIAPEAKRLRALGLSLTAIASHLGVTGKTVAKAISSLRRADED